MLSPYVTWHLYCKNCGYEKANLSPSINEHSAHQFIDETAREKGLREVRLGNYNKLLICIKSLKPQGGRLLDVGCAHGWFLETASNDFEVLGVEPDEKVGVATSRRGLPVRIGCFPEALYEGEKFDVIVFNDVIEHIPDIKQILVSCHQRLNKGGLLLLNLPSSNGVFYRLSKVLFRLGCSEFFERLWQKNLPSPHLHYFNPLNLVRLLGSSGFDIKKGGTLSTLRLGGLHTRISYVGTLNCISRVFAYLGVLVALPLLKLLPRDIFYLVLVRK